MQQPSSPPPPPQPDGAGIYLHSSRGFTRTGAIKPDLAAPGVRLLLPDYQEVTGTSFAAAMTAGAAAILLSWSAYTPSAPRINTSIAKAFLESAGLTAEIPSNIPAGSGGMGR
ncbi:MAG: S8 family serine peptidase [Clostridium sp.]